MNRKHSSLLPLYTLLVLFTLAGCKTPQTVTQVPPPPPNAPIAPPPPMQASGKDYAGYYPNVQAGKYDNGKMWTFSYPPKQYFKDTYGFDASDEWLDNVRMSALRFANYCSASFVSANGLVMTNHHCGRESVTEVTRDGEDLPTDGFYAATLEEERKVDGLYLDQLVGMQDITADINDAMKAGSDKTAQAQLRSARMDEIVKSTEANTGLKAQIHTFYNGSIYQLYTYKRYTDVRLVMAPETDMGYYGGDPDNFTFPRYTLDFTFFRVYGEDGKPIQTKNHYTWSEDGYVGDEPLFVVGNPGTTKRLSTVSILEYDRDYAIPHTLDLVNMLTSTYWDYLVANPDKKLELMDTYFSYANSQKAYTGMYGGLKDPVLMGKRASFENSFKDAVKSNPELNTKYGHLWSEIAASRAQMSKYFGKQILYSPSNSNSRLFRLAAQAVSLAEEMKKPADQRRPGNSDEEIKSKVAKLSLPDNYYPEIEEKLIAFQMSKASKWSNNKFSLIDGQPNPAMFEKQAANLARNSIVAQPEKLRALFDQGPDAVLMSKDPILSYTKTAQDSMAYYRTIIQPIAAAEADNIQLLGQAMYEVYGTAVPPDANMTLRIADGTVKTYNYNGTTAPEFTTFHGLYDRYYSYNKQEPYRIPELWVNTDNTFDKSTKFNFISTHDIIGGNSGSAMINAKGEVVGLIFDGNIESLPGRYIYDVDSNNRCVSVHSSAILQSLRHVYKAERLADELEYSKIK